jgi:hypothetical protein
MFTFFNEKGLTLPFLVYLFIKNYKNKLTKSIAKRKEKPII